ncbi:YihY/virulence factor BrkB family protein [Chloroflexi bacterium TSY]|nr:YihY/virulence factor BrkB family protein [Chloroflexi bacterium TSY]
MSKFIQLALETGDNFDQQNMASYAAAIAYHTIISLGPLLLFAITVASMFVGQDAATEEFTSGAEKVVGPDIAPLIANVVGELSQPTTSNLLFALIWLCITFYAASNVFRHLVIALDTVWELKRSRIDQRLSLIRRQLIRLRTYIVGLMAALTIIIVLLISLIARATIDALWETLIVLTPQFANLISLISNMVIPLILITFSLLAVKFLPNISIPWRDVWLGAVLRLNQKNK